MVTAGIANQRTRDQIGSEPTTKIIGVLWQENVLVEEGPSQVTTNTIGNSWIVGSSTNGIVGANTGTQGGGQQVVGGSGRVTTIVKVVNPSNRFIERFAFDNFKDSTETNTADWNTTLRILRMDASSNHARARNTTATFKSVFLNDTTVVNARIIADETTYGNDIIKYFLSADAGASWQEFTLTTSATFAATGTDIRVRIVFIGNGGTSTYIDFIKVFYNE